MSRVDRSVYHTVERTIQLVQFVRAQLEIGRTKPEEVNKVLFKAIALRSDSVKIHSLGNINLK